jgi:5'(3')-deoxyribonucleotidase
MRNLYLDVDGVMADLVGATLVEYNLRTWVFQLPDEQVTIDKITQYSLAACGLDMRLVQLVWDAHGFAKKLKPLSPTLKQDIAELREKYNVFAVTQSRKSWHADRIDWLAEHAGIEESDVIIMHKKHLLGPGTLVDDCAGNVDAFIVNDSYDDTQYRGLIFNQPWNCRVDSLIPGRRDRISSLGELL